MAAKRPIAFLSYAHSDDAHEGGKLRQLAERLSGEVQLLSGEEFPIFVDRKDLKVGDQWEARIDKSLDAVTFLIPILTPNYFRSAQCRREILRFIERERALQRDDLILPLYYKSSPVLENKTKLANDEVAKVLSPRHREEWRHLRLKPLVEVGPDISRIAHAIVRALQDIRSVPALIDRRASAAGSPYKKAIICLRHRSNAEDLFDRAFSSGGDVLYVTVMSQATLKTMRARLDACKATGTTIRVLTWHRRISQSVIEAYRKHLNEPDHKRAVRQAREATKDWRALEKDYPRNLSVREYSSIPTIQGIVVHDKWPVLELIPYATHTGDRPALVLTPERDPELFELFARQFELLWDHCIEPSDAVVIPPAPQ